MMETILWQKEWVTKKQNTTNWEKLVPKMRETPTANTDAMGEMMNCNQQSYANYEERMDCKAICCCGCKDDQVEARVAGGNVCWSCLSKVTILPAVCSVARSLPAHKT